MEEKIQITNSLKKVGPLSRLLIKTLHGLLVIEEVPRKHKFLELGQVCQRVYFITGGLVRGYYFDENLSERTAWIMKERDVIMSVGSFYTQEPSKEYIETLEPSIVGSISFDELEMIYAKFPKFNFIGRLLTQHYYTLADKRTTELRTFSATEKYRIFTERYPDLKDRVPLKYIASYLGLKQETLYRIRNGNYNTGKKHKIIVN